MAKERMIRCSFSRRELQQFYGMLGGKAGELRDFSAIADKRPSEIAKDVADIRFTQDRISRYLTDNTPEEPEQPTLAGSGQ